MPKENKSKEPSKKIVKLINLKYLHELKKNDKDFQIVFTQKNSGNRNINFLHNKEILSCAKTFRKFRETKTVCCEEKLEKDNRMISFYDGTQKKISTNKNNSIIAYTKKWPNDLIKSHNLNRSTIISKYSNSSSLKEKGRCFSCTNNKNKSNVLINYNLRRNASFYNDNITSVKRTLFQTVNPFIINDFSFKDKNDYINRKALLELIDTIAKIEKSKLLSMKTLFFQNLRIIMNNNASKISLEEYKLLEELKSLGVTNKKELNILLKDIYFGIKGKN
jgi:hypothetical protein